MIKIPDDFDVTSYVKHAIIHQLPQGGVAIAALLKEATVSIETNAMRDQYRLRTHWHWCIDGENFTTARDHYLARSVYDGRDSGAAFSWAIERATNLSTDELLNFAAYI